MSSAQGNLTALVNQSFHHGKLTALKQSEETSNKGWVHALKSKQILPSSLPPHKVLATLKSSLDTPALKQVETSIMKATEICPCGNRILIFLSVYMPSFKSVYQLTDWALNIVNFV